MHLLRWKYASKKKLKLVSLHSYTRKICKVWIEETWFYEEKNVQFGKCRKLFEHRLYRK